jgi:hypothetical protein
VTLPVLLNDGGYWIADPDTGEAVQVRQAPDYALLAAAEKLAELDAEVLAAKRVLATELRERHGIGTTRTSGFAFKVHENVSWPLGATREALDLLVSAGKILPADRQRCLPKKEVTDGRQLKALLNGLLTKDPDGARILADAATTSPPSVRELQRESVEGWAA